MFIYGDNIPPGTYVATYDSATKVFMSERATATGAGLTFSLLQVIPLDIQGGKLQLNFEPTPSEYYVALASRIRGKISGEEIILGSSESTEPIYDAGPWITEKSWRYWDEETVRYIATLDTVSGLFRQKVSAAPTANRKQYLPNQSGTVAYLLDAYVPRETVLLTPAANTTIDWSVSNTFLGRLDQNTTIFSSNESDGQKITICLINNGTEYTVTWPSGIFWVGADPTQPIATAGQTVVGVYVIRRCPAVTPGANAFGEFLGAYTISSEGASIVNPGGPGSVPGDYGEPIDLGDGETELP